MLRKIKISHRLMGLISVLLVFTIVVIALFINSSNNLKDYTIDNTQTTMMQLEKNKLKVATHSVAMSIAEQLKMSKNLSQDIIAQRVVENIRFEKDSSGYFYVCEQTTIMAHPINKGLIGKDLNNEADSTGVYYVRELFEHTKKGGGFTSYVYPKPGKGTVAKLGYAEIIPGTEMWVGTGIYIDNIDEAKKQIDVILTDMTRSSLIKMMIIILAIFGIILLPLSLAIRKTIIKPLNEAIELADAVAQGNLNVNADTRYNDEVGLLSKALDNMVGNLKKIVGNIVTSSTDLASASEQISSTSQQLSQGSSEQASATEEVSSSIEEMTANIQQNSENSQQTEKISISALESIRISTDSAMQAISSMKKIAERITIIGDIADKTDLLAINASIEAARAGEHGKGFAVVAAEVRKLAERSQIAADEINELTVSGLGVADKAGKELTDVIPEIEKTAKLVQEITAASLEQDSGAGQINSATAQLNGVTQQNAAAAEELAASAKELNDQAERLSEIVSFFKTEKSQKVKKEGDKKEEEKNKKDVGKTKIIVKKKTEEGTKIDLSENKYKDQEYEAY